jgi:hypothetical protein
VKTGAAPPTRKCLDDPQVRKSIGMDKDYALLVNSVQEANEYAVYALTEAGYDGSALIRPSVCLYNTCLKLREILAYLVHPSRPANILGFFGGNIKKFPPRQNLTGST